MNPELQLCIEVSRLILYLLISARVKLFEFDKCLRQKLVIYMCVWFSFSPLKAKEISKDFKAIGFLEEDGLFLKKLSTSALKICYCNLSVHKLQQINEDQRNSILNCNYIIFYAFAFLNFKIVHQLSYLDSKSITLAYFQGQIFLFDLTNTLFYIV